MDQEHPAQLEPITQQESKNPSGQHSSDDEDTNMPIINKARKKVSQKQTRSHIFVILTILLVLSLAIINNGGFSEFEFDDQEDDQDNDEDEVNIYEQNDKQPIPKKTQIKKHPKKFKHKIPRSQKQDLLKQVNYKKYFEPQELRKPTNPTVFEQNPVYWETNSSSEYSEFYDQKGELITLRYRKPEILKPEKVPEKQPGQIGKIDIKSVIQYISRQKDRAYFVNSFLNHQSQPIVLQAEYFYYTRRYNIEEHHQELPLCILSPYRNFYKNEIDGERYLEFLNSQNYSNFEVIMIDDLSNDNSPERLLQSVKEYPRLNNRLTIVKNKDHTGALGNRDLATRKLCRNDSVIVEIDADDYLMGRQVFNLYNTYYQEHPNVWFMYSNYIYLKQNQPKIGKNKKIPEEIFSKNNYRTSINHWQTVHLRSYLKQLYMKIPVSYYLEQPDMYFLWASDRFNMYALTELANKKHTVFLPESVYHYQFPTDSNRPNCQLFYIRQTDFACRTQIPLIPLHSLTDQVKITQNYKPPDEIIKKYNQFSTKLQQCMKDSNLTKDTI